jgi:hypothetical protein
MARIIGSHPDAESPRGRLSIIPRLFVLNFGFYVTQMARSSGRAHWNTSSVRLIRIDKSSINRDLFYRSSHFRFADLQLLENNSSEFWRMDLDLRSSLRKRQSIQSRNTYSESHIIHETDQSIEKTMNSLTLVIFEFPIQLLHYDLSLVTVCWASARDHFHPRGVITKPIADIKCRAFRELRRRIVTLAVMWYTLQIVFELREQMQRGETYQAESSICLGRLFSTVGPLQFSPCGDNRLKSSSLRKFCGTHGIKHRFCLRHFLGSLGDHVFGCCVQYLVKCVDLAEFIRFGAIFCESF